MDQSCTKQKRAKSTPPPKPANKSDPTIDHEQITNAVPISDIPNTLTHLCYSTVNKPTGQIYSNQTGKFNIPSSKGNNYIFCLYNYDSNFIFPIPIKNQTQESILSAYKEVFDTGTLKQAGLQPNLTRLDNECSNILKEHLIDEGVKSQLAPPYIHRRNATERAIRTLKNHFIAALSTCIKEFPLHIWDDILPQAVLTLNLLCSSCISPKLSAHAQVHRNFTYNSHPLGPPGTRVLVHKKSANRKTWAPHATEGWYISPAFEHYRY
jgi:hypothetical protein